MIKTDAALDFDGQERGVHVATIELEFDESAIPAAITSPMQVVERDAQEVFRSVAVALTLELHVQVSIIDIVVSQGSIKIRAKIIAFIIPIIQGAVGGAIGNLMTQPTPNPDSQRYEQVCETVRTTTETQTRELFAKKGYKPKTTVVTTVTYEEICRQIQRPKGPS